MRRSIVRATAVALLASASIAAVPTAAHAANITINFETPALTESDSTTDFSSYDVLGVHISNTAFGIVKGLSQRDVGWSLEGTLGPQFLGNNGGDNDDYSITFTLDAPRRSMSIDCSRSDGSAAGDSIKLTLKSGATEVFTTTSTFGNVNTWTTLLHEGTTAFDTIVVESLGTGYHPYGCDRLVLSDEELPSAGADPAPLVAAALLCLAAGALFLTGRRRLASIKA